MLANESGDARLDQGFQVCVVDGGEGEVEHVEGGGSDGREVSVEEDEVEDAWTQDVSGIYGCGFFVKDKFKPAVRRQMSDLLEHRALWSCRRKSPESTPEGFCGVPSPPWLVETSQRGHWVGSTWSRRAEEEEEEVEEEKECEVHGTTPGLREGGACCVVERESIWRMTMSCSNRWGDRAEPNSAYLRAKA